MISTLNIIILFVGGMLVGICYEKIADYMSVKNRSVRYIMKHSDRCFITQIHSDKDIMDVIDRIRDCQTCERLMGDCEIPGFHSDCSYWEAKEEYKG